MAHEDGNMKSRKQVLALTFGLCCGAITLSAAFFAGAAWAADAKFDLAYDNLVKAKALLIAAENPGFDPPFNYHRRDALRAINRAMSEIELAKDYADSVNPPGEGQ
jgi:hypothetical protein